MDKMSLPANGLQKHLTWIFYILASAMVTYHLYYILKHPWEPSKNAIIHLGLAFTIVLLTKHRRQFGIIHIIAIITIIASSCYFFFFFDDILEMTSYPPAPALVAGVAMILIVLILAQKSFGWIFFVMAVMSIAYMGFGHLLPGLLHAPQIDAQRLIAYISADVTSPWGLYGGLVILSANYLFLFLVFGAALDAFGGIRFINEVGYLVASRMRSGPAALSVFTSALIGMFTGSTVANITITGAFTIPFMKKTGYSPEQAGAIETVASSGGQILPPIMGATVFVLASYTNIPYIQIAKVCLIPALIYFASILLYAELNARILNLQPVIQKKIKDKNSLLFDGAVFLLPLLTLVFLLVKGFSPMATIFWSILALGLIGLINTLRPGSKLILTEVLKSIARGVSSASELVIILALIGMIVGAVEVTGLGMNIGIIIVKLCGNSLILLLIMTAISSLVLGMAVPSIAAYLITATILSPALIKVGVPLLQAHLFPMYYAVFSHITPPIALGLMVACKMAGGKYMQSAKEAIKAVSVAYLLPFFFIYTPAIILQDGGGAPMVWQFAVIIVCLVVSSAILNNQWAERLGMLDRAFLLVSVILSFIFIFGPKNIALVLAGALFGFFGLGLNAWRGRQFRADSL